MTDASPLLNILPTPQPEIVFPSSQPLSPLYRQAWLLTLLAAAERLGVTPLSDVRVHNIAYLANCLAPVYDLLAPDRTILKGKRGPYYPEVQWDLDRLVISGLVEMVHFEPTEDAVGMWFAAEYVVPQEGLAAATELEGSPRIRRASAYLVEVLAAYEPMAGAFSERVRSTDANYADPNTFEGMLIDFGEWVAARERNYAYRTTLSFDKALGDEVGFTAREKIHLYLRYLTHVNPRVG